MTAAKTRVIRVGVASVIAGAAIGLVGAAFRYLVLRAEQFWNLTVHQAHSWLVPVLGGMAAAALARWLVVRYAPYAAGSGIQHVEAVFDGEAEPPGPAIVPVKFFGGLLALGSGLALGREGPTVQMGATLARLASWFLPPDKADLKLVDAAGAGAGLAVAFNAPIGGSIFVFEELTSSFNPWLMVATLSAASVAVWVMRAILGDTLDFLVIARSATQEWVLWPFLAIGLLLGAIGAAYNATMLGFLAVFDSWSRISSIARAGFIGAVVGLIAWWSPKLVGGGDVLAQSVLSEHLAVGQLALIFFVRFFIGPWSYAAGTPGGLFAPLLVAGASFGALFGETMNLAVPGLGLSPIACAVVGMAALFAATVRSPLTGIVLAVEMTGRSDLILGSIVASLGAMVVAMLLNSEPIYQPLKRRMLAQRTAMEIHSTR